MSHDEAEPQSGPHPAERAAATADDWVAEWASLFGGSRPQPTSADETPSPSAERPTGAGAEAPSPATRRPAPGAVPPSRPDPAGAAGASDGSAASETDTSAAGPDTSAAGPDVSAPDTSAAGPDVSTPPEGSVGHRSTRSTVGPRRDGSPAVEAWEKAQERARRQARARANRRRADSLRRHLPDPGGLDMTIGTGTSMVDADGRNRPDGGRLGLAAGAGLAVVLAAAVIGYLFTGVGGSGDDGEPAEEETAAEAVGATVPDIADDLGLVAGASIEPRSTDELALSTVQLLGLDDQLEPKCAGSGVVVRADGTILTNAHVVRSSAECRFTTIGVAVTLDAGLPPELRYLAEVEAVDLALDLAVLRVSEPIEDDDWPPVPFVPAPLGNSETVNMGDEVRILGYPVIGGDTITLTTGTIGGFTAQTGVGARALFKTDAVISAGNSGGLAADAEGRVIGIPTKARASESGPAIDCRAVSDTNGDGKIDDADTCVPVGGFLNGVRPINLARPLLAAAAAIEPVEPAGNDPRSYDVSKAEWTNPRFSLDHDANQPVDLVLTAPAGIPRLCFFVDYANIPVGARWDGLWYVDDEIEPNLSRTDESWTLLEQSTNYWLCAEERNALGLPAGTYEIAFYLENTLMFVEAIEVTSEPIDVVAVKWENLTGGDVCELAVNPLTRSERVGLNILPDGLVIPPGGDWTTDLPVGTYAVEASNCNGDPVADRYGGLSITGPITLQIGQTG